jgi:hypothetical protein
MELLATTTSRELAEWEAHFALRAEEELKAGLARTAAAKLEARPRRRR